MKENTTYKEYYDKIYKTLGETIEKKFPECVGQGTPDWAKENRRALYDEIMGIEDDVSTLWETEEDFEGFKKRVLAWGKGMLTLYGEHQKWLRENPVPKEVVGGQGSGVSVGVHYDAPTEPLQVGMF